jgi:hypothetical protein
MLERVYGAVAWQCFEQIRRNIIRRFRVGHVLGWLPGSCYFIAWFTPQP